MTFEEQIKETQSKAMEDYFESVRIIRDRPDLTAAVKLDLVKQIKTTYAKRLLELPDFQRLQHAVNAGLIPPGILNRMSMEFLEWISGTPEEYIQEVEL